MTPKFVPLDDAAEQLGITKDVLNALREQGSLRAYKDGASWKFRSEDVERMVAEGVPSLDEGSELGLDLDDELEMGGMSFDSDPPASEADVTEAMQDAVSDDVLDDDPESILLSEPEMGDSSRPPSTIIGKVDLDAMEDETSDLKLKGDAPDVSDVRLAEDVDVEILEDASATGSGSGSDPGSGFDDLDELELDLEAESSRVLAPEDIATAQKAAQAQQQAPESGDLRLEDDFEISPGSAAGLTGLSALELEDSGTGASQIDIGASSASSKGSGLTGLSALELEDDDEDDDFVLGDGSDITLSAADSGINLSPSDSGLSLDDPSLAGSAIGSSLDLGSQIGGESFSLAGSDASLGGEGFELSPVSEADGAEDEEDSSQVIALDAFEESQQADDLLGGGDAVLTPAGTAPAAMGTVVVPQSEQPFGAGVVSFLGVSVVMVAVCGIAVFDIVRNMWSWDKPYSVSSSLIDGLTGLFF